MSPRGFEGANATTRASRTTLAVVLAVPMAQS